MRVLRTRSLELLIFYHRPTQFYVVPNAGLYNYFPASP